MLDCTKDICAFHDNEVTLLQPQRIKMRNHRNANRDRLKTLGLPRRHAGLSGHGNSSRRAV